MAQFAIDRNRPDRLSGLLLGVWLLSFSAYADIAVPAGASYQVAGGNFYLACSDLFVSGAMTLGAGGFVTGVRSARINANGELDISGSSLELAQDYSNHGIVISAGGAITRVNSAACPAEGALGLVNPSGQAQPITAKPVPTMQGIGLLALSLGIVLSGGQWLRRKG